MDPGTTSTPITVTRTTRLWNSSQSWTRSSTSRSAASILGLGTEIVTGSNITFKTGIVIAGTIVILMAFAFDAILIGVQRLATPWRRASAA